MKKLCIIFAASILLLAGCRSVDVTNFEVLNSKDSRLVYRVDMVENGMLSTRQAPGFICVPDSKGDLVCR